MNFFNSEGKQISPSIITKVKHALGLKAVKPANQKTCSEHYWDQACEKVGEHYKVAQPKIIQAKFMQAEYM